MTENTQNLELELHKRDLKIQALLEDVTQTRDKNAELRVEITMLSQQNAELVKMVQESRADASEAQEATDADDK